MRVRIAIAVASAWAIGCGDPTPCEPKPVTIPGLPAIGQPVPLEWRFLAETYATCVGTKACPDDAPPPRVHDATRCAVIEAHGKEPSHHLDDAVARGEFAYDAQKAADCVAALAKTCHADWHPQPAACDGVLVPLVPLGGACRLSGSCAQGYCKKSSAVDLAGVCTPNTAPYEPCINRGWDHCAPGHMCAWKPGHGDLCLPYEETLVGAGTNCINGYSCKPGLWCIAEGDQIAQCRVPRKLGESCSGRYPCKSDLCCWSGKCTSPVKSAQSCDYIVCDACPDGQACRQGGASVSEALQSGVCWRSARIGEPCRANHKGRDCKYVDAECRDDGTGKQFCLPKLLKGECPGG